MTFTIEEKRLLILYCFGSSHDTVGIMRETLSDIHESDVYATAVNTIVKVNAMDEEAFDQLIKESGDFL